MAFRQTLIRSALPLRSVSSLGSIRTVSIVPRATAKAPFVAQPFATARTFRTFPPARRQGREWADKGTIAYSELAPIAKQPSGEVTIIDVREPDEVAAGMIPSAVSVPLTQFDQAFDANKGGNFERDYSFPRPSFDAPIVFYCRSGKRSAQAQEIAARNGWTNTRNYEGSWLDWTEREKKAEEESD